MSRKLNKKYPTMNSKRRPLRYLIALPALALSLVVAPATSSHSTGAIAGGLSKRFLRFNEYLFNGTESSTAVAAVGAVHSTQPIV